MNKKHPIAAVVLLLVSVLSADGSRAQDANPIWRKTDVLSAPEANQAAAVDERSVYAISNTIVAKYERRTGLRLATSTGEATHLNSGFVWHGRVDCAHSNYP